jgi:AcrR family transcriptional regulator
MAQRAIATGRDAAEPDLRERILRTAARCFAKDGYERTRMTSVARIAGVSRAALYKHFSTKAELLRALNDFVIAAWRIWMQESVALAPTAREAIELWLRVGLTESWRIEAVRALTAEDAQGELLMDGGATRRALGETHRMLALVLRRGIETGELRPELDVDATAHVLQALLLGLQRNRATDRPIAPLERRRELDALIDLVLGGLLARPGPAT